MLKYYDVKCTECGNIEEQLISNGNKFYKCSKCGGEVKRVFTTFNYKLVYNNKKDICGWSFNNYDRSRYWDEVKSERAKGRDVKPANEK